jgi:hypothetical protein
MCGHSQHAFFIFSLPHVQARKAFAVAVGQGRIDPSWADGKELRYHSPAATNIDVGFNGMCLLSNPMPHDWCCLSAGVGG